MFNRSTNEFKKFPDPRIRIFSLGQADFIVNKIPREVTIESLEYRFVEKRLMVSDGGNFAMDINEFGHLS